MDCVRDYPNLKVFRKNFKLKIEPKKESEDEENLEISRVRLSEDYFEKLTLNDFYLFDYVRVNLQCYHKNINLFLEKMFFNHLGERYEDDKNRRLVELIFTVLLKSENKNLVSIAAMILVKLLNSFDFGILVKQIFPKFKIVFFK